MKVGITTSVFSSVEVTRHPGINRYAVSLTRILRERSVDVRLLIPSSEARIRAQTIDGVEVIRVPDGTRSLGRLANIGQLRLLVFGANLRRRPELLADLDVLQTDLPLIGIGEFSIPVITFIHHLERVRLPSDWLTVPLANAWTRHAVHSAYSVVVPSRSTARDVEQRLGVPKDKLRVIHHGVDLDFFRPGAGELTLKQQPILLYVGRLEIRKRVDRLLYAMQQICRRQPLATLLIIGEGPERKRLESLALKLGIAKQIVFLGEVSEGDLLQWYQSANLFVFASEHEGFGFVIAEALACGKAIVALDTPVSREILGDAGILVDPEDITCLGEAVLGVLDDDSLLREYGHRARRRAEELFDRKKSVMQYLALYREGMTSVVGSETGTGIIDADL